jgi:hypothetical protein
MVQVGDGARAFFWIDRWLNGSSIRQITPYLWNVVPARTRNTHTFRKPYKESIGLGILCLLELSMQSSTFGTQYLIFTCRCRRIARLCGNGRLRETSPRAQPITHFSWGELACGCGTCLEVQAPGKCRFFALLVLHGRCWTSNRLR